MNELSRYGEYHGVSADLARMKQDWVLANYIFAEQTEKHVIDPTKLIRCAIPGCGGLIERTKDWIRCERCGWLYWFNKDRITGQVDGEVPPE